MQAEKEYELKNKKFNMRFIPVVDHPAKMNLLFMIRTEELQHKTEEFLGVFGGRESGPDETTVELSAILAAGEKVEPKMINKNLLKRESLELRRSVTS